MNDELTEMWAETMLVYLKALCRHFQRKLKESHKTRVKTPEIRAENLTRHIMNERESGPVKPQSQLLMLPFVRNVYFVTDIIVIDLFKLTDSEVIHYSGYYLKTNILIL